MLVLLIEIVNYLLGIFQTVITVWFVLSLLIAFNVVNMHNPYVAAIWRALEAIMDPLLQPIRRLIPRTPPIDFSPMALIIVIQILQLFILPYLARVVA
ncbi:MAG: YggT family protein [Novosphingobium sp.]